MIRHSATAALTFACVSAALVLGLASAPAQGEPDPRLEDAKAYFREAIDLEADGRWSEATQKLRQALQIKETPGLRFHLAYCEEQQGHYLEALTSYRRAQELIADGQRADDVVARLAPAVERVFSQIAQLTVELEPMPKQVELRVDGRVMAPDKNLELNPGSHLIQVTAPGWLTFKRTLRLHPGPQSLPVLLKRVPPAEHVADPEPPPVEPVTPPPEPQPKHQDNRKEMSSSGAKTWVLAGEAVLLGGAIAAGIGFTLKAGRDKENADLIRRYLADGDCTNPTGKDAEYCSQLTGYEDARSSAKLYSTLSFVGAGVTASALVLTAVLWRNPKHGPRAHLVVPVGPRSSWGLSTQFAF